MSNVAVTVVAALSLLGHNDSEGSSRFVVDADGGVAISVQLLELDLPELCDVDFADADNRDANEAKVDACVKGGLSSWLRLRVANRPCSIVGGSWHRLTALQLVIEGKASCPRPADERLTIDWGLFAGKELEHVNSAVIVLPDGRERSTLFSRRHNKVVVEISDPHDLPAVVALGVVAVVAVITTMMLLLRRRRAPAVT